MLLGGDFQGGKDASANYWSAPLGTTARTSVAKGATITADGVSGAGGNVVVWADDRTSFAGHISATGITAGGDAEVSGKAVLEFAGTADLTSASGSFGTLLLDPYNVTISTGADANQSGFTVTGDNSVINATTLLAALNTANVTVSTGSAGSQAGDITVAAPLAWTSDATLMLDAAGGIAIDADITARAGGLTLDAGGAIRATGAIDIARFTLAAGDWVQNAASLPGFASGDFRIAAGAYFGVEPKWVKRTTSFAGVEVAKGDAALFNLVLGWAGDFSDRYGRTSIDARIKANPGGVLDDNNTADWIAFTGGRVTDNTYVTAGIDITRTTRLPHEFFWVSQFSGLAANQALPDPERLGLSGYYAVRGYGSEEAAADTGLIWRNELRLPAFSPLAKSGIGLSDSLSPFAFVDLGHGYDFGARDHTSLASTGLGFDYAIGSNLTASLTGAVALADANAGRTRSGDMTLTASVRIAY